MSVTNNNGRVKTMELEKVNEAVKLKCQVDALAIKLGKIVNAMKTEEKREFLKRVTK